MKNVLILSSSPRRGGNSDTLCDEFMQGAIESGHRVERFSARQDHSPLHGMRRVQPIQEALSTKDDAAEIIGKMLAADVIVMATPVYFYAMSAQMKTLIDRCCGPYTEMKTRSFTSSPRPLKKITASWIALWPTLWDSSTVWRTRP